ncbi:MAG: hypothetical protein D3925_11290 [Candidatus Electrothrix sp. AR5]|nr:hypothetical protein [Candidatus Electrothrix sp. AR5]
MDTPPLAGNLCIERQGLDSHNTFITLRLGNRVEGKSGLQTRTVAGTPLSGNRKLSVVNLHANANTTYAPS